MLVYSVSYHGRVTHQPGLDRARVSLQGYLFSSQSKIEIGCSTKEFPNALIKQHA
jgi:hypothetical protein